MVAPRQITPTQLRSAHDRRGELGADTVRGYSKLGDKAAGKLAVHVIPVLNSIPKRVR
ncbi:MAG: hypothetical protein K0U71_14340 [Actinomycetia bacterium]|nr:hypothetical protein [Actinomycetes bacterium]